MLVFRQIKYKSNNEILAKEFSFLLLISKLGFFKNLYLSYHDSMNTSVIILIVNLKSSLVNNSNETVSAVIQYLGRILVLKELTLLLTQ